MLFEMSDCGLLRIITDFGLFCLNEHAELFIHSSLYVFTD